FITTADGLTNNVVQGIAETRKGIICITTEDGCALIDAEGNNVLRTIYFDDEIRRNFYNERCIVRMKDGRMALGSLDGIVMIDNVSEAVLRQSNNKILPVKITG
ncbi:hypothetical protein VPJ68_03520, partial [Parabacteroides distasonis]